MWGGGTGGWRAGWGGGPGRVAESGSSTRRSLESHPDWNRNAAVLFPRLGRGRARNRRGFGTGSVKQTPFPWGPSHIEELDTYYDGKKWWFRCSECAYFNNGLYRQIHIKGWRAMLCKRKFMDAAVIPFKQKKPRARKQNKLKILIPPDCRAGAEDIAFGTTIFKAEQVEKDKEVVFTFGGESESYHDSSRSSSLDEPLIIGHGVSFSSNDLPTRSSSMMPFVLIGDEATTIVLHICPRTPKALLCNSAFADSALPSP